MAKQYGLPYKGSKSKIAEKLIAAMPPAENFYDLFAGGCAMAHAAMESGKYRHIVINDLEADITQLFVNAVGGKYHDEKRWISREDFERLKDTDPYVRYCWSFGNNGRDYLYRRELEPYKKALHEMLTEEDRRKRRVKYKAVVRELYLLGCLKAGGTKAEALDKRRAADAGTSLQSLEGLESLERLERLQSLERLEGLERLERYSLDYQEVPIKPHSVIYCDIPYRGTDEYQEGGFDHERFYDWARRQTAPLYISEYAMPEDRFVCLLTCWRQESMAAVTSRLTAEKLFTPRGNPAEKIKADGQMNIFDIREST